MCEMYVIHVRRDGSFIHNWTKNLHRPIKQIHTADSQRVVRHVGGSRDIHKINWIFDVICKRRHGKYILEYLSLQIAAAALSKAWFYGRLLPGVASSNPLEGRYVRLSWTFCIVRSLRRADRSSKQVLSSVTCLGVFKEPHRGLLGPLRLASRGEKCIYLQAKLNCA
jgi:hypothetical protein